MNFTYGATTITISSPNGLLYPLNIRRIHWDTVNETENGVVLAYDHSVDTWIVNMRIRCNKTLRDSLESFYRNTLGGRSLAFTITPDTGVDLGAGTDTDVQTARIWDASFSDQMTAWNYFIVELTIRHIGT
jgi:hypothetical protein